MEVKMFAVIVLVSSLVQVCLGAIAVEVPYKYIGYGKCLSAAYPEMGVMKVGESKQVPNRCEMAECDDGGYITFKSCGDVAPDFCIYPEPDHAKPYPDCCPKNFTCDKYHLNRI